VPKPSVLVFNALIPVAASSPACAAALNAVAVLSNPLVSTGSLLPPVSPPPPPPVLPLSPSSSLVTEVILASTSIV